jgi:hypothetical protein
MNDKDRLKVLDEFTHARNLLAISISMVSSVYWKSPQSASYVIERLTKIQDRDLKREIELVKMGKEGDINLFKKTLGEISAGLENLSKYDKKSPFVNNYILGSAESIRRAAKYAK